jgi:hypothetical protein
LLLVLDRLAPLVATVRVGALRPALELGRVLLADALRPALELGRLLLAWRAVVLLLLLAGRDVLRPEDPLVEPLEEDPSVEPLEARG